MAIRSGCRAFIFNMVQQGYAPVRIKLSDDSHPAAFANIESGEGETTR